MRVCDDAAMRQLLDPRYQGERARHAVYDLVVLLSVLVALQDGEAPTDRIAVYLLLTLLGVAFAELYAGYIAATLRLHRRPTPAERRLLIVEVLSGIVLAGLPLVWVVLGSAGVLSRDRALDLALATGVILLGAYAIFGARAAHLSVPRSLAWGVSVSLVGIALISLTSALH